jgi:uncharacterized PurR-regulated membrane protein YhhQ (DUF165 family)
MYQAFLALPPISQVNGIDYSGLYRWVLIVPLIFLIVDVLRRTYGNLPLNRPIVWVDVVLLVGALNFWLLAEFCLPIRKNATIAYLLFGLYF